MLIIINAGIDAKFATDLCGVQLIKKKIDVMRSVGLSFDIIKVQLVLTH